MMDKELKNIVWAYADELRLGLKAENYDLDGDENRRFPIGSKAFLILIGYVTKTNHSEGLS